MIVLSCLFILLLGPVVTHAQTESIQQQIDSSQPGDIIELNEGKYNEDIIIDKPIHLIGSENVILTAKDSDPVISIKADNVVIENMLVEHINKDGESPAIVISSNQNTLEQLKINTNNHGIQLDNASENKLSDITIIGNKNKAIKERKHGIDLKESHNNELENNSIKYVQDGIYVERSDGNKIRNNNISQSRYAYHLMFTKNTKLEKNNSSENVGGMYIMGAEGTVVKHNILKKNQENIQSLGLLVFDTVDAVIAENEIINNRIGIFVESASDNNFEFNTIHGNYIGLQFKSAENNNIVKNSFVANVVQGQAKESFDNNTSQNYWGDHLGLDVTGNRISDLPYKVNPFFLSITNEYPSFQLLFQSPGMIFLEQVISTPDDQQLVDRSPLIDNPLMVSDGDSLNQVPIMLFCMTLLILSTLTIYLGVKKQ